MKKHIRPAIIWLIVVLIAGYVGRRSISHDHVPRFMNGYSYAESAYAVTRQLRDETHALRSYVRQLPWPEDGWIFEEWRFTEKRVPRYYIPAFGGVTDTLVRFHMEIVDVDSIWSKPPAHSDGELRYELRGNGNEAYR